MTVIFVGPLVISIVAAGYMVCVSDTHPLWRVGTVLVVLVAAVLQMIGIHFLIPLLIQVFVSIGVLFWAGWEQSNL